MIMTKTSWKIFFDLQCPYSKKCWQRLPSLRKAFQDEYDMQVHLTSLLFHPQAFTAQCAATYIKLQKGQEDYQTYCDACFEHQERYMNAALGDAKKSEIDAVFCDIAEEVGLLDESFTRAKMLEGMHDWEGAVKPALCRLQVCFWIWSLWYSQACH